MSDKDKIRVPLGGSCGDLHGTCFLKRSRKRAAKQAQLSVCMVKNIVLCFDGTRENFGPRPYTNVLKIYRLLDTVNQVCYYQPGIGTESGVDTADSLRELLSLSLLRNTMDTLFAFSLDEHIMSAYIFLMQNFEEGDSVYMFGFSRGAFLARVLAGMIERVGLLNDGLGDMVGMAWKLYKSWEFAEQPSQPDYMTTLIQEFRRIFCRPYNVNIEFQGLFDSVNSVGLFRERMFPCTQRSNIVQHVRHAVSIDERRGKFKQVSFTPTAYFPRLFSLEYKMCDKRPPSMVSQCIENAEQLCHSNVGSQVSLNPTTKLSRTLSAPLVQVRRSYIGIGNQDPTLNRGTVSSNMNLGLMNNTHNSILKQKETELKPSMNPCYTNHCTNLPKKRMAMNSKSVLPNSLNRKASSSLHCSQSTAAGRFKFRQDIVLGNFLSHYPYNDLADLPSTTNTLTPDLKEKWFPGDHCDIGGGWDPEMGTTDCLSDVSLRWILGESIKCGVKFKSGKVRKFAALHPSMVSLFSPSHDYLNFNISNGQIDTAESCELFHSCAQQEVVQGMQDIPVSQSSSLYNSEYFLGPPSPRRGDPQFHGNCTKLNKFMTFIWWVLELLPIGIRIEDRDGKWRNIYVPNLGRRRYIPYDADMHWSVFWRMKYDLDYNPTNLPSYVTDILSSKLGYLVGEHERSHPTLLCHSNLPCQDIIRHNIEKSWYDFSQISGPPNASYYEALYNVVQWERENWSHVPDDLAALLAENGDL
ncbi:hypothetical protein DAKH74_041470 [Maudiozyma humilis]|uniref:T6SS Phospholipase effector Tle1-like catalytic domain-containing protein n=1 Tax=Maudiozyma humilis TaxID=51915 RepID=A0AAV5S277_MAUHU|nr:hypothetical protein DAKH74_041470 [Kazachstania humilis]